MTKQDIVRKKLIERCKRERQFYIAQQLGISSQSLSNFKQGVRNLSPETLEALNDYLNDHYIK